MGKLGAAVVICLGLASAGLAAPRGMWIGVGQAPAGVWWSEAGALAKGEGRAGQIVSTRKAPVKVRLATVKSVSDAGLLVALARGYFAREGIELEFSRISAPPQMVPLLATGELDVAGSSITASLFNALGAGVGVKIVAAKGAVGDRFSYIALMVRKDLVDSGRYRTPQDLRGMSVGTPGGRGVTLEAYLAALAEKAGLRLAELRVVQLGLPDMPAALANRSVDAVFALEPTVALLEREGLAVRAVSGEQILPNLDTGVLVYGPRFRTEAPDLAQGFMNAYVRGMIEYRRLLSGGRYSAELIAILARELGVDPALLAKVTPALLSTTGTGAVSMRSLQYYYRFFRQMGYVKEEMNLGELVDHSYVQKAWKLVGAR